MLGLGRLRPVDILVDVLDTEARCDGLELVDDDVVLSSVQSVVQRWLVLP
jgi:hypothetical protein